MVIVGLLTIVLLTIVVLLLRKTLAGSNSHYRIDLHAGLPERTPPHTEGAADWT